MPRARGLPRRPGELAESLRGRTLRESRVVFRVVISGSGRTFCQQPAVDRQRAVRAGESARAPRHGFSAARNKDAHSLQVDGEPEAALRPRPSQARSKAPTNLRSREPLARPVQTDFAGTARDSARNSPRATSGPERRGRASRSRRTTYSANSRSGRSRATPDNPKLRIEVLDGNAVKGNFWILDGGLTDPEYTLTITDTVTGEGVHEGAGRRWRGVRCERVLKVTA
jgi:hypothetical protein